MDRLVEGRAYVTESGEVVLAKKLVKSFYDHTPAMTCEDRINRHVSGPLVGKLISINNPDNRHPANFVREYISPEFVPTISKVSSKETPLQLALF